ncbi:unnamed protein product [Lampetra planeri]
MLRKLPGAKSHNNSSSSPETRQSFDSRRSEHRTHRRGNTTRQQHNPNTQSRRATTHFNTIRVYTFNGDRDEETKKIRSQQHSQFEPRAKAFWGLSSAPTQY